jgi:hypothetical protein
MNRTMKKKKMHLFSLMVLGNFYLALALSLNNKERRRISYTHRHLGITVGGPGGLAFFYPVIIIKSMTHRNFNKRGIRFLCAFSSLLLTAIKFYSKFYSRTSPQKIQILNKFESSLRFLSQFLNKSTQYTFVCIVRPTATPLRPSS